MPRWLAVGLENEVTNKNRYFGIREEGLEFEKYLGLKIRNDGGARDRWRGWVGGFAVLLPVPEPSPRAEELLQAAPCPTPL